ncbi:Uncharacterized protein HZ326_29684 [Fusarium oxysporum f. sp. albedinis]|nr:Uncharacterized protein HZ326_29684 [Fusarium oxysporum f. sp. albedinis]
MLEGSPSTSGLSIEGERGPSPASVTDFAARNRILTLKRPEPAQRMTSQPPLSNGDIATICQHWETRVPI